MTFTLDRRGIHGVVASIFSHSRTTKLLHEEARNETRGPKYYMFTCWKRRNETNAVRQQRWVLIVKKSGVKGELRRRLLVVHPPDRPTGYCVRAYSSSLFFLKRKNKNKANPRKTFRGGSPCSLQTSSQNISCFFLLLLLQNEQTRVKKRRGRWQQRQPLL